MPSCHLGDFDWICNVFILTWEVSVDICRLFWA
jgi:hypothetical protein